MQNTVPFLLEYEKNIRSSAIAVKRVCVVLNSPFLLFIEVLYAFSISIIDFRYL